ncbi:MAG: hypothetical protein A3K14_02650 [Sulfurimonas sp. RIFCSPLOWO2_12_FULL_36_74]|uniref:hypothetical protein n=1 Tax=Sulfurimonas sp. RIFCSPLOWO2_12_36_12 TaxID=1802253 RepID=UPI0008B05787|nr:hypothetical protein [Sulfurimonas sp. RIFCSPLOWO2_12_36_12]OHE02781.1 MAG: hypothetical protein A2W82_00195 [Sulfurimonas sp. RIFCSPLOWO2_12_36_12]OHE03532.1 MAG: hypothetical protein A3K14_02650 [Sulfurimonas sp. RIFCSPLOWO2_12_FULL_36_74]
MRSQAEIDFDLEIFSIFYSVDRELEYIENALEFLNQSLSDKFEKLEEDYNNSYHSLYLEDYKSDFYDNYPNKNLPTEMILEDLSYAREEEYQTHDTISGYIIQSILVKQVSVIEKFLKSFYKYAQDKNGATESEQLSFIDKIKKNGIKKYICNLLCIDTKKEKQFSDIRKTASAITKITTINIKELDVDYWRQLRIMNELRNRFAHGSNEFVINKEILQDLKKEFGNNFISEIRNKDNNYLCKIENDFEPLIKFNQNMRNYIKQLESEFRKYYNTKQKEER